MDLTLHSKPDFSKKKKNEWLFEKEEKQNFYVFMFKTNFKLTLIPFRFLFLISIFLCLMSSIHHEIEREPKMNKTKKKKKIRIEGEKNATLKICIQIGLITNIYI